MTNLKEKKKEIINESIQNYWNVKDEFKSKTLTELRDFCDNDRLPFAVCTLNVTGDLNVGMMMRTALIMGAERFFIIGDKKYDRRSTVGAQNYMDVVRVSALTPELTIDKETFFNTMKEYGYTPVFAETNGIDVNNVNWSTLTDKKICLVFGNEGMGIPTDITDGGIIVSIKQRSVLRSLNVSAAASILMHEIQKSL